MKKVRKAVKYAVNIITILAGATASLAPIWNIPRGLDIAYSMTIIAGVLCALLLGDKTCRVVNKHYGDKKVVEHE